tara:strand:+ start:187 stop:1725 length:1539 start_codon:yes stop_codon:yes gene_type:complete
MKKKFYITTPIYYPSGKPHMGHAYSSIIADVIARFKRIEGFKVLFLTGTDEHGLKIQREAEKNKMEPKAFCDKISRTFIELTKILNLSNNDFIRTTEDRHKISVEKIWKKLETSGQIYLDKYNGWYSVSDEAYYDEDETLEIDGQRVSKTSGSKVEWVEEKSYFFKLSSWEKKLLDFYKTNPNFISPHSRKNEVVNFVKKGLKDLSISRTTFSWGLKVPGQKDHVIYVWLDALTNYLSAVNFPNISDELYKDFWPADLHVIGKDILRFHAIYWPAFLLAADIKLPKRVFGHGWILSDEKKMSKSLGNILDPVDITEKYGSDQLRYYLMKEVSHGNDGNISLQNLENCINNDLANNFGNLCQRVFSFIKKNFDNKIPKYKNIEKKDGQLNEKIKKDLKLLSKAINNQELNLYIKKVVDYSFEANKYFNDAAPWDLKDSPIKMGNVLYVSLLNILYIAILLNPLIPIATIKVLNTFKLDENDLKLETIIKDDFLKSGTELNQSSILFKKVEHDN